MKELLSWGTLTIAVVGAVLGVLNTWRAWSNDRVRLRVSVIPDLTSLGGVRGIEVVNLSTFAVTIDELGWTTRDEPRIQRLFLLPVFLRFKRMPVRLEPRASMAAYRPTRADKMHVLANVHTVYARTACGTTKHSVEEPGI